MRTEGIGHLKISKDHPGNLIWNRQLGYLDFVFCDRIKKYTIICNAARRLGLFLKSTFHFALTQQLQSGVGRLIVEVSRAHVITLYEPQLVREH